MLTDRNISTSSANLRVTESDGHGMPLVLLHGSGASRAAFDRQLGSPLAERHRLVAIDLPGHGESDDASDPQSGYTITGFAATVIEAFAALSIDRAVVLGWSLGGHIAIEVMAERPDLVAGLMVSGAPPVARGPIGMLRGFHANWDMLLASKERFSERDVLRFAQLCYREAATPELVQAIRRADGRARVHLSRSMMRGDGADQKRTIEQASVPIALVSGELDPIVRVGYMNSIDCRHLFDGHALVLDGTGHAPFRDAPERFNAVLNRFAAEAGMFRAPAEMPVARIA